MDIIKVVIVDDHIIFRKGLIAILNEIDDVKVVGEASNGHDALVLLKKQAADVVLMDIKMPRMDGIEATQKITERYPDIRVVGLTMFEEISYFNKMVESGAIGFLLKKTNVDELEAAIHSVYYGESYFSEEFMSSVTKFIRPKAKKSDVKISERELDVLKLICKGMSNNEISKELNLSPRTIDGHRANLLEKTGAKNSANLVMFAVKHGLV
jgi:DNA-binding NarL/FixJ family response regulator